MLVQFALSYIIESIYFLFLCRNRAGTWGYIPSASRSQIADWLRDVYAAGHVLAEYLCVLVGDHEQMDGRDWMRTMHIVVAKEELIPISGVDREDAPVSHAMPAVQNLLLFNTRNLYKLL